MQPEFKKCDRARYMELLEVVFPVAQRSTGFLVGEPYTHRECTVTGRYLPAYTPVVEWGSVYWEGTTAITVPEWRALNPATLKIQRTAESQ